ncbi:MAG: GAF domain-containing protein, partial [Polyangiaceae bacterium]|nr:GAF domain-containing protein [Polyangiaceae bacterium]
RTLGVERVGLWWFDEDRARIRCLDLFEQSARRHSAGQALVAADYPTYFAALETARVIAAADARTDPRTREYCEKYLYPAGIASMLDVPVRLGGRVAGILCHEHVGLPRAWQDDEQAFAASVSDLVAQVLEARERRRAQDDLRVALALLRATLDTTGDGILVTDLERNLKSYNRKLLDLWQIPESVMSARDGDALVFMLAKTTASEGMIRKVAALYGTPKATSFDVVELSDGRVFECQSQPQRLDTNIAGRVWIFRDVTLRRLAERERDALIAKERSGREAAELLAEVSGILAESLDYEINLARLARLCVKSFADWCYFGVIEGGQVRVVAAAHRDHAKDLLLEHVRRSYTIGRWDPTAQVLRTVRPVLLPELTTAVLHAAAADSDEYAKLARDFGAASVLSVPALARGRLVGMLTFLSAAPGRRYGAADLVFAEELARRVASAIDLGQLHRRTEQAVRQRDEFLSIASHELRTPVASLQLALQALRRGARAGAPLEGGQLRRLLEVPERQTARLVRLVDSLLDVSRIEAGKLTLRREDVDLLALARDVAARLEYDLARAKCPLSIQGEPVIGRWDRSRLDQVATNLLTNSIRYGAGKPIDIVVSRQDGTARLAITDRGIGIAPDCREHIFERFVRAAPAEHYPGLGLGLYISRVIVEAHGGTLTCTSRVGAGSTFTMELPRIAPAAEAPEAAQ